MSVNLSIKDVPDELAERLRERAARNHRSLQRELMAIVEAATTTIPPPTGQPGFGPAAAAPAAFSEVQGTAVFRSGRKTIEQIAAEHRARFPKPITGGPLAVDIIRADRDSR